MRFVFLTLLLLASCGGLGRDYDYPLSGDYHVWRNSAHVIQISPKIWGPETPIIESKVVEVAWDNRFILAKRQGLKRRSNSPNDSYEIPDPDKFDYWILDTTIPKRHGPFDEVSFLAKRKELDVSESLKLRDVYSYYK